MINIPIYKQSDGSRCGPAAIRMVLAYYGLYKTEDEIALRCSHTFELGCTDMQMKAAIESYGFKCTIKNLSKIDDLKTYVTSGTPVIVDWFSPGHFADLKLSDMPNGHSSVINWVDDENVYMIDPEFGGNRIIKHADFMRAWFDWRQDPYLQRWDDLVLQQMILIQKK